MVISKNAQNPTFLILLAIMTQSGVPKYLTKLCFISKYSYQYSSVSLRPSLTEFEIQAAKLKCKWRIISPRPSVFHLWLIIYTFYRMENHYRSNVSNTLTESAIYRRLPYSRYFSTWQMKTYIFLQGSKIAKSYRK